MNAATPAPALTEWKLPSHRKVGIACLIVTESALFSIFVVAYIFYIGKSLHGPFPKDVLDMPVLASICLFGSSLTVVMAEKMLHRGSTTLFHFWWLLTMALGAIFLWYTGTEWYRLIYQNHLTISTNVFGTTFYSLVGLHASHVIVGLILLSLVVISSLRGKLHKDHYEHVEMISWYWHFVDAVWLVVLSVVYIFGR